MNELLIFGDGNLLIGQFSSLFPAKYFIYLITKVIYFISFAISNFMYRSFICNSYVFKVYATCVKHEFIDCNNLLTSIHNTFQNYNDQLFHLVKTTIKSIHFNILNTFFPQFLKINCLST